MCVHILYRKRETAGQSTLARVPLRPRARVRSTRHWSHVQLMVGCLGLSQPLQEASSSPDLPAITGPGPTSPGPQSPRGLCSPSISSGPLSRVTGWMGQGPRPSPRHGHTGPQPPPTTHRELPLGGAISKLRMAEATDEVPRSPTVGDGGRQWSPCKGRNAARCHSSGQEP